MKVTFKRGDGKIGTFTYVSAIVQHTRDAKGALVELRFKQGHSYPANEVYLGFEGDSNELTVEVTD